MWDVDEQVAGGAGSEGRPGHAVLVASPAGPERRRGRVDAGAALPALAAVAPGVLLGTGPAGGSVVQLVAPDEVAQIVAALRTAAAAPGPVLLYLSGWVLLDGRQRLPHLALSRSTVRTVRWDGLPWHWIAAELHARPGGTAPVTLVADLVADAEAARALAADPDLLGIPGAVVRGAVLPGPERRRTAAPVYGQALATALRAGGSVAAAHRHAAGQAAQARPVLLLDLHPDSRPRAHASDAGGDGGGRGPHAAAYAAARAGRHGEAAAVAAHQEQLALRDGGPRSGQALHWGEVRADLAHLAGDHSGATRGWLRAATQRLAAGQPAGSAEVRGAVDRAHHCWHRLTAPDQIRELGALLVELREQVPGPAGALTDVQHRLHAPVRPTSGQH